MKKSKAVLLRLDPVTFDLLTTLASRAGESKNYTLRSLIQDAGEKIGLSYPRLDFKTPASVNEKRTADEVGQDD